jgi:hypothetical protein
MEGERAGFQFVRLFIFRSAILFLPYHRLNKKKLPTLTHDMFELQDGNDVRVIHKHFSSGALFLLPESKQLAAITQEDK